MNMEPYGWVEKEVSQGGWFVRQANKPDAPGNWIPLYAAAPVASQMGESDPPEVPEVLAPVYKFLMERCHYWQPIFDDESLPPAPWYGMVEIEIERSGKHEFCEAKYESGLFGGPPQWSSWNASEGNYEVLRWLKKWELPIGVRSPVGAVPVSALEKLETELRETAETIAGTASAAGVLACADRLSALIKGNGK